MTCYSRAMKRAAMFVVGFASFIACVNDFDALTAGPARKPDDPTAPPKESSTSGGGGSSGDTTTPPATVPVECKDPSECVVQCAKGQLCEGNCASNVCNFEVTAATGKFGCNSSDCELTCAGGATCVLDCMDSLSCDVTCDAKSACVVSNCGDACTLSCAGGKAVSCGGKTQACGACPP